MNEWIYYGLVAALFISIKDILFTDLIKKYDYVDLIIVTNIILLAILKNHFLFLYG